MNNLIKFYSEKFNLQNATFNRIEHEDALVGQVYKISQPDGKKYILKICSRPHDYLCEIYFLNYFLDKLPVPHILEIVSPESDFDDAILMEYLHGDLLKTSELNDQLAYEIGSLLAKIHTNQVAGYGDLTKVHHLSLDPTSYFTFKFEEGLAECSNHLPKKLLNQCDYLYKTNIHLLASVDGPCITHRDFRPGNIIVNEGKVQGIIDWSSARGSFAEEDFCSLALGDWTNDPEIKKSFLKGYASIRNVPNYSGVMPLLLLSKAIATIGFTVKTGTWGNKNKNLYQRNRQLLVNILKKI
jgi:Ser/Thr protein kinase RdoA (MazF antagonist)